MKSHQDKHQSDENVLRVAFPYAKPAHDYEPTQIHLAPEYIFLENVYSPLVEMSPSTGELVPGVAEAYAWHGDELHLKIRNNLKTVDGILITPADVEFSLKRLLVLSGNTHGNFQDIICPNSRLTSIASLCDGITSNDQEVILKTKSHKSFLMPMLAAIDFAILPKSSVDKDTLKITDYRNTSGPYYVEEDSGTGNILLRANPHHYHYDPKIPQTIKLVPTLGEGEDTSLSKFKKGEVDFISTIDKSDFNDVDKLHQSHQDTNLHTTMNIRSYVIAFSERGQKELDAIQRFQIGRKLQKVLGQFYLSKPGFQSSKQFFPSFGEGALSKDDLNSIPLEAGSAKVVDNPLTMNLVRVGSSGSFKDLLSKEIPNLFIQEGGNPSFVKYNSSTEMPHLWLAGPDTGFLEDIGLISYTLNAGYFGMKPKERHEWLAKYMSFESKSDRLVFLREAHLKAIKEGILFPIATAPYVALARKPWKIQLSQLYANNPLWLITKE